MTQSSSPIPGRATPEGTRARLGDLATRGFGRADHALRLGSVGLGTYLGPADEATDALYRAALDRALDGTCFNVVDTASNYRRGRSERVIGRVLRERIEAGGLRRDQVFVASKAGYLYVEEEPGPNHQVAPLPFDEFVAERLVRPGIVHAEEIAGGVHCLAPGYLDHCIERSRARLGLETIDAYYLHNPESHRAHTDAETFRRRLRLALETLEVAVADGRIACIGVATWQALRLVPSAPQHQSLVELLALAREVAGPDHHLRVVQLPYNLALTEARTLANQPSATGAPGSVTSLLDAARDHGVYVMTSAPLLQGQLAESLDDDLARAIDEATHAANPGSELSLSHAQRALQFARSTPGVGTALVGAKQLAHVEAAAQVAALAPLPPEAIARLYADFGD